jgi:signal transduction histidine kinase
VRAWLARSLWPGLTARIAGAIVLALVTTQALNILLFVTAPEPQLRAYQARAVIDGVARAVAIVSATPRADRAQALEIALLSSGLAARMTARAPTPTTDGLPPLLDRLRATIKQRLSGSALDVAVSPSHALPPRLRAWWAAMPTTGDGGTSGLAALSPQELDTPLPGFFEIDVELNDGSWLSVATTADLGPFPLRVLVPTLIGSGLIIAILSAWTSRRMTAPLTDLVAAVGRMGQDRRPTPITIKGLAEFKVVADALNEMQTRLLRFVDERTQMLAAISHDLRTPLTRMRILSEYVANEEQRVQLIGDIDDMRAMIDATLAFAAGDFKSGPRAPTDLATLIISLCDVRADHGQRIDYSGPDHLVVMCQPLSLKRAMENIIDNAIKYGNAAHVSIAANAGDVAVVVRDEGGGIPPDKVETAFAPFRRLEDSRNPETGGVGLGLTIARDVVGAHGGQIELRQLESGFEVRVTLPIN